MHQTRSLTNKVGQGYDFACVQFGKKINFVQAAHKHLNVNERFEYNNTTIKDIVNVRGFIKVEK